jgi:magnesium-protoporphyrin O-methyltransferase
MLSLALVMVVLTMCAIGTQGFKLQSRMRSFALRSSVVDDKAEVEKYFNGEGFSRWNKIYSESDEVNKVQLDIRNGHQQTIDKVLLWMGGEDNKRKTVCDAGCGTGSLALPMSSLYKKVFASDISAAMTKEAAARAKASGIKNVDFKVSDMEKLNGKYNTVTCIDVMIHYPTDAMYGIVAHLGGMATDRLILSFAVSNAPEERERDESKCPTWRLAPLTFYSSS